MRLAYLGSERGHGKERNFSSVSIHFIHPTMTGIHRMEIIKLRYIVQYVSNRSDHLMCADFISHETEVRVREKRSFLLFPRAMHG